MSNIWLTSDLHLGHDRDFVWGARGFDTLEEMEQAIVERFNSKVQPEDDVYLLGDSMLGDLEHGFELLKLLNGKKHFIIGNHDTKNRITKYAELTEFPIVYADVIKYKKKSPLLLNIYMGVNAAAPLLYLLVAKIILPKLVLMGGGFVLLVQIPIATTLFFVNIFYYHKRKHLFDK